MAYFNQIATGRIGFIHRIIHVDMLVKNRVAKLEMVRNKKKGVLQNGLCGRKFSNFISTNCTIHGYKMIR
jgi:hypothetical protein